MGIALLTFSSLIQGWSALHRQATAPHRRAASPTLRASRIVRPSVERPALAPRPVSPVSVTRPATLRVVQVRDAHAPTSQTGRLVISGRMADVCAELDRLVAREAALKDHATRH